MNNFCKFRYFIPEDGDDEKHPNVFKVDKDSNLTLADIKKVHKLSTVISSECSDCTYRRLSLFRVPIISAS